MRNDFGPAGQRLFDAIIEQYECSTVAEEEALAMACRTADEIAKFETVIADAPVTVDGPRGRPIPNPLYEELRRHRVMLLRALKAIGLDDAAARDPFGRSSAGRALAGQRWKNR